MAEIADYDQARVDRLAQAIGWALGNETTFTRLAHLSVDESGIGDREGRVGKRFKIHGILRDALRERSVGVIEENAAKGLVKYAKPAGVIASIVPMTNPELTPPGTAIYAIKARDAVIFSPHPRTKRTTNEVVRILRDVMEREGAPADVFQCVEESVDTAVPGADGHLRPDIGDRRCRDGQEPPTARASRPSVSAEATRRW